MGLEQAFIIVLLGFMLGGGALFFAFYGEYKFGKSLERIGWTRWADGVITPYYNIFQHPQNKQWYKTIKKGWFGEMPDVRCSKPSPVDTKLKAMNPDFVEIEMFWTSEGQRIKSEINEFTKVLEENEFLETENKHIKELALSALKSKEEFITIGNSAFLKDLDKLKRLRDAGRADSYQYRRKQKESEEGDKDNEENTDGE